MGDTWKDDDTKEEKARRTEYHAFLDEKADLLRLTIGEGIGKETRLRLINEGRFHCCFLVVLLIYVLGTYFNYNLNSVVLFDNLGQKYLSSPLPQTVWPVKKTFYHIDTMTELELYLQHIVYPEIYAPPGPVFSQYLGGARIRQLRVADDNCTTTISPGLLTHSETFSFPCFPGFGDDTEATEPFGNSNQYNWTSADENGANAFLTAVNTLAQISFKEYPGSGYVVDLGIDPTEANTTLNELFTGGYFDKYTRAVFVEFTTFTPTVSMHLNVQMFFERQTAGTLENSIKAQAIDLYPYSWDNGVSILCFIMEIIIVVWTLVFVIREFMDMFLVKNMYATVLNVDEEERKEARLKEKYEQPKECPLYRRPLAYCSKFFVFWELLHLTNVGLLCLQLYWKYLWLSADKVEGYNLASNIGTFENLYPLAVHYQEMRIMNALTCFLSIIKLLKYMQLSLKLNILVLTLVRAKPFLAGFSLMFMGVFTGYSLMGLVIYGGRLDQFNSFQNSVQQLFAFLTGHFNYVEMKEVDSIATPIYVYSYMLMVSFVLLNMFIAILNESFSDVSTTLERLDRKARLKQQSSWAMLFLGECGENWVQSCREEKRLQKKEKKRERAEAAQQKEALENEPEVTELSPLSSPLQAGSAAEDDVNKKSE